MSNDIRNIIERLAILEGRITPVDVKHGLNADQKAAKQLPALFKPRDISPTLSKKPYQKHPMDGWLVGEEEETDEAVVMAKNLSIHDPEGERFANPDAEADVNVAAKWKEVNKSGGAPMPGWVAGYPKTDNKSNTTSKTTNTTTSAPNEKFMGPADVVDVDAKEVKEALAKLLAHAGVKEGNIPDRIPSTLDVINYKDYVSQMKKEFGDEWTPDPEPMKPYDTKNLGQVQYSQPPVEEDEDTEIVKEAKVDEEKLLDKVKKSLTDYLASVEEKLEKKIDRELGEKPADHDLGEKSKKDRDLVAKELEEDPTEEDPVIQAGTTPLQDPTYAESACVKSVALDDGAIFEIHGDEHSGFEIRHGNRSMKSRFKNIDEATSAIEMFRARQQKNNQSQDYVDEA